MAKRAASLSEATRQVEQLAQELEGSEREAVEQFLAALEEQRQRTGGADQTDLEGFGTKD